MRSLNSNCTQEQSSWENLFPFFHAPGRSAERGRVHRGTRVWLAARGRQTGGPEGSRLSNCAPGWATPPWALVGVFPILRLCPTPASTCGIRIPRGSPRLLVGSGRTSEVPPLILRAQHPLVPRRTRRAEPVPDHPHHTPRPSGATRDGTRPPPPKPSSGTVASEGGDPTLGDGPRGPPAPARPRAAGTSVRTRWAGSRVPRGGRPHRWSPRRPHVGCPR